MGFWVTFWQYFLVFGFVLFALVTLGVTILGVRDIRQMLHAIQQEHDRSPTDDPP